MLYGYTEVLSGKINPAKKQGLSFTIPTGFLYNPLCGNLQQILRKLFNMLGTFSEFCASFSTCWEPSADSAQAFQHVGNLQRILRELFNMLGTFSEFCASFPTCWESPTGSFFHILRCKIIYKSIC
jgi:hypothetical protein